MLVEAARFCTSPGNREHPAYSSPTATCRRFPQWKPNLQRCVLLAQSVGVNGARFLPRCKSLKGSGGARQQVPKPEVWDFHQQTFHPRSILYRFGDQIELEIGMLL